MNIDINNMKIYDISMPISYDMPVYKGKEMKRPIISVDSDFSSGSTYESRLEMNMHTGTHIDRSLHMVPGGTTLESLRLEQVVAPCTVLDLTEVDEKITKEDLISKEIKEGSFLLLKTRNSYEDILEKDFIYLDNTGAELLASKNIIGVGIDSLGIERNQPGHETHLQLLSLDMVILEGLRLKEIEEGDYLLSAAPILIPGIEAAPVRAYLIKT
ncbi:MAG TPA: cyclase family protein [Mobilitalea sp.]|nr:cyclase family protein [Mobilitalea sp.]